MTVSICVIIVYLDIPYLFIASGDTAIFFEDFSFRFEFFDFDPFFKPFTVCQLRVPWNTTDWVEIH